MSELAHVVRLADKAGQIWLCCDLCQFQIAPDSLFSLEKAFCPRCHAILTGTLAVDVDFKTEEEYINEHREETCGQEGESEEVMGDSTSGEDVSAMGVRGNGRPSGEGDAIESSDTEQGQGEVDMSCARGLRAETWFARKIGWKPGPELQKMSEQSQCVSED